MNILLHNVATVLNLLQPTQTRIDKLARIGSAHDGGYVMIDDFLKSDCLISFGIASDVTFEKNLSNRIDSIDLYDFSIEKLPEEVQGGRFYKERIGAFNSTTIRNAIDRFPNADDLILKMDIEGSEWETLEHTPIEELKLFRQIVVEFHWLENLIDENFATRVIGVLSKLNNTHFILNSHPNNWGDTIVIENILLPSVIEVSFLRRGDYEVDTIPNQSYARKLSLYNRPCNIKAPDIYLSPSINIEVLNLDSSSIGIFSNFSKRKAHNYTISGELRQF